MLTFRKEQFLAEEIQNDLLAVLEKMESFCEEIDSDISNKQLAQIKSVYNRAKKLNKYMNDVVGYNNTPEELEQEKNSFYYRYHYLTEKQKKQVAKISYLLSKSNVIDGVTARLEGLKVEDLDLFCSLFGISYDASGWGTWNWIEFLKDDKKLSREDLIKLGAAFDFDRDELKSNTEEKDVEKTPEVEEALEEYGYGFVEPNGNFIESDFGTHTSKAYEIIKEKGFHEEWKKLKKESDKYDSPVDFLVYVKKYILMHNPIMGGLGETIAQTPDRITKAQREFLYDYYTREGNKSLAEYYLGEE